MNAAQVSCSLPVPEALLSRARFLRLVALAATSTIVGCNHTDLNDSLWLPKCYLSIDLSHFVSSIREASAQFLNADPGSVSGWCHKALFLASLGDYYDNTVLQSHWHEFFDSYGKGLVLWSATGPTVRTAGLMQANRNDASEYHSGQLLAALAACSVPRDYIICDSRPRVVNVVDLLESARLAFLSDVEPFWLLSSFFAYFPRDEEWSNKLGEACSYDLSARSVLEFNDDSYCFGAHKYYVICCLLQLHDFEACLSPSTANELLSALRAKIQSLSDSQHDDGSWSPPESHWVQKALLLDGRRTSFSVTAHHLEWLAIAPPEILLDIKFADGALGFIIRHINLRMDELVREEYPSVAHALRAVNNIGSGILSTKDFVTNDSSKT